MKFIDLSTSLELDDRHLHYYHIKAMFYEDFIVNLMNTNKISKEEFSSMSKEVLHLIISFFEKHNPNALYDM